MSKKVKIKLDGKTIEATTDQTILDVAAEKDKEIPTLCNDDNLEPFGSCWVCVVKVKDKGFVPSCATKVYDGMEVETGSKEVFAARQMALELLLSDHYADCSAPCSLACPAQVDIQGYIALINNNLYHEANKLIKKRLPIPLSVGRVCPAFCEDECRRQLVDDPIAIRQVKRYAADKDLEDTLHTYKPEIADPTGKEVAIIGAGPAGLSVAYFLAQKGHKCTIFEAQPKSGGMLRYGIPEFRLPKEILDKEIELIKDTGVTIKNNIELGKDFTLQFLYKSYDAIFLGLGAWKAVSLRMEGEDLKNCHLGIDFLNKVYDAKITKLEGTVAVIGGGNTAMDAARTAIRLGADNVKIVYRRAEEQMPAEDIEIEEAKEEGVEFNLLQNPSKILGKDGKVTGMECVKMRLGEPDDSGRRRPIPIENSGFILKTDYVIPAISQKPLLDFMDDESSKINGSTLDLTRWNSFKVNEDTKQTNIHKIFAGGDVVRGPATVIEAVADAKKAANSMHLYLMGEKVEPLMEKFNSKKAESVDDLDPAEFEHYEKEDRVHPAMVKADDRVHNFQEIENTFTKDEVIKETARCIECGCDVNQDCALRDYATDYDVIVSELMGAMNKHPIDDSHPFIIRESNKCINCGRCVRTCLEIQGVGALGYINRGFSALVAPEFGDSLLETSCESCGKCIQVCPVGALTQRNTNVKTAPIDMDSNKTTCELCGCGCQVEYFTRSNIIMKSDAVYSPITKNNICFNARFGFEALQINDRLTKPLLRKNGELEEVEWQEAYEYIHDNIDKLGPNSATFASGNLTNEELFLIDKIAEKYTNSQKLAWTLNNSAIKEKFNIDYSPNPISDLDNNDMIILVGKVPHTLGVQIIEAIKAGHKLMVINREENKFSRLADYFIKTDNYLKTLNKLARMFVEYRHHNVDYIVNFVQNFVDYNQKLLQITHSAEEEKYSELLADSKVLFVYSESDLDYNTQCAILNLSILKGDIGNKGRGILTTSELSNKPTLLSYGFSQPTRISEINSALIFGEDPLFNNKMNKYEWLNGLDFLLVADSFLTETAKMADIVLPQAPFTQKSGTIINNNAMEQKVEKIIDSPIEITNIDILTKMFREEDMDFSIDEPKVLQKELKLNENDKITMEFHKENSVFSTKINYDSQRNRINSFKNKKLNKEEN
ncbi:MAG: FAD-dependent oxidoreductase [Candidatus Cloacimonetes bacterium]|nr:FAD-dependent oxidoreductase [Candidatus Cloacimonadota bacterium]